MLARRRLAFPFSVLYHAVTEIMWSRRSGRIFSSLKKLQERKTFFSSVSTKQSRDDPGRRPRSRASVHRPLRYGSAPDAIAGNVRKENLRDDAPQIDSGVFDSVSRQREVAIDEHSESFRHAQNRLRRAKEPPAAILRDLASRNELSIEALVLLLRRLRDELDPLTRHERRKYIQREPMCKHVLRAIWARDELWRTMVWDAHEEMIYLCLYAHVEGEEVEQLIADWLRADVPAVSNTGSAYYENSDRWRGMLLRTMISARLLNEVDNSADGAITLVLNIAKEKRIARAQLHLQKGYKASPKDAGPLLLTALQPAAFKVQNELATGRYLKTNAALFDRFVRFRTTYLTLETPARRAFAHASLMTVHPSRPQAQPALVFLTESYGRPGEPVHADKLPVAGAGQGALQQMFYSAATLLRAEHRSQDADMLAQRYEELFDVRLVARSERRGLKPVPKPHVYSDEGKKCRQAGTVQPSGLAYRSKNLGRPERVDGAGRGQVL